MSLRLKSDTQVPLLVKIQTIDVENLDFKSTVSKNKLVTYVDGTSRFLFVGCTSGTVYVFSRDTLQFLFIIPFKGGKVCGISCTEDETEVAVGSLRGRVTLYRLSSSESSGNYASAHQVPVSVKLLYTVSHHNNNEITEMQWSPNGRYLFIGDNQGLISQVDVRSLEEFPRPPPSRVILQVQSRVLQLDCVFPYLAVNTLSGVFLCDIENEDFTRIQFPNRNSILRATGVSLVVSPDVGKVDDSPAISLFVAASNSNSLLRFGVQGNLLENREINENSNLCQKEVLLFDPKKHVDVKPNTIPPPEFKPSFGKLFTTDDGYIISASNHQIMIMDPNRPGMETVFWNDEFRRISSLKVLSNYLFIWETGKLHVIALTYFRPYGEQLFTANLHSILENWVRYALNTIGCRLEVEDQKQAHCEEEDQLEGHGQDDNERIQMLVDETELRLKKEMEFKQLYEFFSIMIQIHSSSSSLDDDFISFILSRIPLEMKDYILKELVKESDDIDKIDSFSNSNNLQEQEEEKIIVPNPVRDALQKLVDSIGKFLEEIDRDTSSSSNSMYNFYTKLWAVLSDFYNEIDAQLPHNVENTDEDSVIFKQSLFQNKMSMDNLIQSILWFLKQGSLKIAELELLSSEFPVQAFEALKNGIMTVLSRLNTCQAQPGDFLKLIDIEGKRQKRKNDGDDDDDDGDDDDKNCDNSLVLLPQLFPNYAHQNSVTRWLADFKISSSQIQVDAYLAEIFLLLAPLIRWTTFTSSGENGLLDFAHLIHEVYRNRFFTWLSLLTSSREYGRFPYKQRLSEFLVEKIQGNRIQEIITFVYQDLLKPITSFTGRISEEIAESDTEGLTDGVGESRPEPGMETATLTAAQNLHNFATLVYLKSTSKNSKSKILSSLITNFPFNNRNEEEIRLKLFEICKENPMLVEMYRKACLTDGNSQRLCSCGLAEFYGMPRLFVIPKTQRVVEECILEILMKSPYQGKGKDKELEGMKRAFRFAMQRLLFEKYFQVLQDLNSEFLNDRVKLEIILRSGQCHLLQDYFPFNLTRLELVIEFYEKLFGTPKGKDNCLGCGKALQTFPNARTISWDCIGLWILGKSSTSLSLEDEAGNNLITTVAACKTLNTPGIFSLRFYKFLANAGKDLNEIEDSFDAGSKYADIRKGPSRFNRSSISDDRSTCAALH